MTFYSQEMFSPWLRWSLVCQEQQGQRSSVRRKCCSLWQEWAGRQFSDPAANSDTHLMSNRSFTKGVHTEGGRRVMSKMDKCGHGEGVFKLKRTSTNCTIILTFVTVYSCLTLSHCYSMKCRMYDRVVKCKMPSLNFLSEPSWFSPNTRL